MAGQAAAAAESGSKEAHSKVRIFAQRNVASCFEFAPEFAHAQERTGSDAAASRTGEDAIEAVLEQTTELADAAIKTVVGVSKAEN